jgi:hypothetical protein
MWLKDQLNKYCHARFPIFKVLALIVFTQIIVFCGDPHSILIYSVINDSADTLYIEKPCCDDSEEPIVVIDQTNYYKIAPNSGIQYFEDDKVGWPGEKELNNRNLNDKLKLIKGKDTLDFVFALKGKCDIDINGQIGRYTRTIE